MKNKIDMVVRTDLFEKIGVSVDQLYWCLNKENHLDINGSVTLEAELSDEHCLQIKVNLCDESGRILYVLKEYSDIVFLVTNYDTFTISCYDVSRFFEIEQLHHLELYPCIKAKKDE